MDDININSRTASSLLFYGLHNIVPGLLFEYNTINKIISKADKILSYLLQNMFVVFPYLISVA